MEIILVKGILSGLFIYGTLLIFYVEFRNRKHTDYPSGVKTISLGLLLILSVIVYNLYTSDSIGPLDYGTLLAGLLVILSNRRIFRFLEKGGSHVEFMLNKLSRIKINKYLLIIIILSVIIVGLQYIYNLPLKIGANIDFYEHLACVLEIAKGQIPPHSALTTENVPNQHYGPYIVILGYIYAFTHINPVILFYLAGIVNVFLFIFFSFKLVKEFFGERIALFSVFSMLFLWGICTTFVGIYSVADGYDYFYSQGIAYTLMVASFYFLIKAEHNHKYMVYCLLSSFLLFTTHLLTGFFYFLMIYLYITTEYLHKKEINRYYIFALSIPITIFLLSLLWPYYSVGFMVQNFIPTLSVLDHASYNNSISEGLLTQSVMSFKLLTDAAFKALSELPNFVLHSIHSKTKFGITDYPTVGGIAIAGVIGLWRLLKNKQFFFPILFFCCLAMLVSKIVPPPVPWRFIFFSMIPLHIGFGILIEGWYKKLKEFKSEPKKIMVIVIVILILLSSVLTMGYRTLRQDNIEPINMKFIEERTNPNAVILTDGLTGFAIPGLTGRKIVYPIRGSFLMTDFHERETAIKTFFDTNSTEQDRTKILNRYNVSYILINKEKMDIRLPYFIEYEDNKYLLYTV